MKDQGIGRLMYVTIEMTKNGNKSLMNKRKMNQMIRAFDKLEKVT